MRWMLQIMAFPTKNVQKFDLRTTKLWSNATENLPNSQAICYTDISGLTAYCINYVLHGIYIDVDG